jgi:hypothetical protein
LIACFQTLEHLSNPRAFVQQAWTRLKPGGLLAMVTHDYKSVVNRLLGKRSPIIDIEHLQLFCKKSLLHLLHEVGFAQIQQQGIYNCYPLSYWIKLTPFPKPFKMALLAFLTKHPSVNRNIKVPVGNVLTVAYKPVTENAPNRENVIWREVCEIKFSKSMLTSSIIDFSELLEQR